MGIKLMETAAVLFGLGWFMAQPDNTPRWYQAAVGTLIVFSVSLFALGGVLAVWAQ